MNAHDASTSNLTSANGLTHIPAKPNSPFSQANLYNVDDQTFTVNTALLTNLKSVIPLNDPFNGVTNPKYIPGAVAQYTILIISNSGAGTVTNNSIVITE